MASRAKSDTDLSMKGFVDNNFFHETRILGSVDFIQKDLLGEKHNN